MLKKHWKNLLDKEDIDIIRCHYLFPAGVAAVEVGNEHGIKTYVTAHDSDMLELYKRQPLMRSIIKKVLKLEDFVLAVSKALRHEIIATDLTGISQKTRPKNSLTL